MDKILNAFSEIASVLPRIDKLKATFGNEADFQQALGLIYSDLIDFHKRAYKIFRRRSWQLVFAIHWGLFERRFKLVLHNLASHCDLLEREAAALHFSDMKQMREKRQLEEEVSERYRHNQMAREVFTWLAAEEDSQEEYLHSISDHRQPETCNWILDESQICSWIENGNGDAVIWMTGKPGAGKSYLCSLIIENLGTRQDLSSLYFFCGQRSANQNRCALLLRTLAVQLLRQNLEDVAPLVHQDYLQKGLSCSSPTMKRLLKEVLPLAKTTRIVLDGIDEYDLEDQQQILKCLSELQRSMGDSCRLLISSRNEPLIEKMMSRKTQFKLDGKTAEGLSLYIRHKVERLSTCFPKIDDRLLVRVKERLERKAKGMFLWVRLVSSMLEQQMTEEEFTEAIEKLPDGLEEAYGRILSRFRGLSSYLQHRIFRILSWICVTHRPIGIHEIADGISLKPGQKVLCKKTRSQNFNRDIMEICAPLLETSNSGSLDLVHFSAKEYLLHIQSGPFINTTKAHFNIAFSCITNLTSALSILSRFNKEATEADFENLVVQGCFGLQSYGHGFWAEHLIAFLEVASDIDGETANLIGALEEFSKVRKGGQELANSSQIDSKALLKLKRFPILLDLVSSWLRFKSKLNEKLPSFVDIHSQEQWQLQTDETFLSLIDYRLREITERLLMMKSSALPSHIDENDHRLFISRFRFACRFPACNHDFDSMNAREIHETTHSVSFPCLQCDFADRGFRCLSDLKKHIRKYHMLPEDFEIPSSLSSVDNSLGGSNITAEGFPRSRCWNEQGRRDLQQGFRQVLNKIESQIRLGGDEIEQRKREQSEYRADISGSTSLVKLKKMWDKIEGKQYQTLTNFRDDVRELSNAPDDRVARENLDVEAISEQELEKAMSRFPSLANFNCTTREEISGEATPNNLHSPIQKEVKMLNESQPINPDVDCLGKRKPYWSSAEEEAIPKLLDQYGRNLIKLADCLRTKTVDEIDQHLIENTELSNLASIADARPSMESRSTHSASEKEDSQSEKILLNDSSQMVQSVEPGYFQQTTNEAINHIHDSSENVNKDVDLVADPSKLQSNIESGLIIRKPEKPKRRTPVKEFCPHCSIQKLGFRDEYALRKHIARFHEPTRSVWICDDISIDRNFFARCNPCLSRKRYSSDTGAANHLRLEHFPKTKKPMKDLRRWMQKTEEPNPNFTKTPSDSSLANVNSRAVDSWPLVKRQKTSGTTPIHQDSDILNKYNLFPAMQSSAATSNMPENPDPDTDTRFPGPRKRDSKFMDNFDLFPDVSFDNFLPGQMTESRKTITDGPPHRTNLAYIRLDQVQSLPHLNHIRKTACYDQVEAFYHILDNEPRDSSIYQETLESLSSLSKTLLRDMRDWRGHSAQAPKIPFSL